MCRSAAIVYCALCPTGDSSADSCWQLLSSDSRQFSFVVVRSPGGIAGFDNSFFRKKAPFFLQFGETMAFSPETTSKQRNRDCAYKIKHGSPKLQEVLRERCRQRMRNKRAQLFNAHRFRPESEQIQDTLEYIIRQEFQNLMTLDGEADLKVEDIDETLLLENEVVQEQEQWIFEEYEKFLQNEIKEEMYADDDKEIFCPICQRAILEEINNCVICRVCELRLTSCTLPEVRHSINQSLNIHAFNCDKMGAFTVLPHGYGLNLYLMCHDCCTLALIY